MDLGDASPSAESDGDQGTRGGPERVCISLGQRGCSFANSGSNGALLENIPLLDASRGPKHCPCHPVTRQGPAPARALRGLCCSLSTRQLWLGCGSPTASPVPLSSPRAAVARKRSFAVCFGWCLHPFLVIVDHTQRTTSVSFVLIPAQIHFQG